MAKKAQDLSGRLFGRLKVLKCVENRKGKYIWLCRCDCGGSVEVDTGRLNNGHTKSCGCLHKETLVKRNSSHGKAKTPMYNVWCSMKARCQNPKDAAYVNYGQRGITVCEKWQNFEGFFEDMQESYKPKLTLERVNNDGNYCLENCIWADRMVQGGNSRRIRVETVNGVTDSLSGLCRRFGFPNSTIKRRLERGWSIERSFNTPRKEK